MESAVDSPGKLGLLVRRWEESLLQMEPAQRSGLHKGISVAGLAQLGTPYAGNSRRYETHIDFGDGVIHQRGKHLFQVGASVSHVALLAASLDGFGGQYVFPDVTALATGQADFYIQSFGDPNTNFSEIRFAAYLQDHWRALGFRDLILFFRGISPSHQIRGAFKLGLDAQKKRSRK